ncbi:replicative DNA helicase [Hyphomonas sp.]|jgi:replicative DNA helicase|uniref:replicative DNA helicase n=1 Tax=Hyphomonas sp. TaxID=87 RepID=UPI000C43474D|nr:replicative DNA helicase [Hyphomonadaceae bacterium]MBA29549.1 replicative DNA helicase [Hyphomonadaceae bacterium]MBL4879538.1 replicative DNA helicase [Hyphomonas sp.]|tara:strand:+ start:642 stop:2138 length:1497 start_codon:yes stop_codon:yes gene_type:complete
MPLDDAPASTIAPPHNLSAEAAVLGAILFDNNAYQRVADILRPSDFYAPAHQELFDVSATMIQQGRIADGVTLREHFEKAEKLAEIGGARYLEQLLDSAAFGPEVGDYARMIRDLAMRRSLVGIGSELTGRALNPTPEENGERQIELAERQLFDLAERGSSGRGFTTFSEALTESLKNAEAAFKREGKIAGIPTVLRDLDEKLGGLHRSDLIILAGRPSMGKTSLATNIAYNAAAAYRAEVQDDGSKKTIDGAIVGFFSLEMSNEQLATRIIAERTGITTHRIRQGDLDKSDFERLREATEELQNLPLYIDDTGGISISQLAARARRLQRSVGLDMIVIDYLQLITVTSGNANANRVQEITQITTSLKALAKDLNVPIIALSQLSRAVEQRDDKRPQLSDLRESGSIEQDADVVMFVYREEYYLSRTEPGADPSDPSSNEKWSQWRERMDQVYGKAEVIIGKQRHGPIGRVELAFDSNITRFGDLSRDQQGYGSDFDE